MALCRVRELEALVASYERFMRERGISEAEVRALREAAAQRPPAEEEEMKPPWLRKAFLEVEEPEGFFATLTEAAERFERAPGVTVKFEKLSFLGRKSRLPPVKTVANANPAALAYALTTRKRTDDVPILFEITGALEPGTLTLVLGAPQSGKSSFLKMAATKLPRHQLTYSTYTFNGQDPFHANFVASKVATYIDQHPQTASCMNRFDR